MVIRAGPTGKGELRSLLSTSKQLRLRWSTYPFHRISGKFLPGFPTLYIYICHMGILFKKRIYIKYYLLFIK